jgi:hypothetical protein
VKLSAQVAPERMLKPLSCPPVWPVAPVDHAHRDDVQRVLIRILAGLKDLEFVLRKIANRIMVLVSRHHVDHHLAGGDMEDQWNIGLSCLRGVLCGHWQAEPGDETGRNLEKVVLAELAGHAHNCIGVGERWGRGKLKNDNCGRN